MSFIRFRCTEFFNLFVVAIEMKTLIAACVVALFVVPVSVSVSGSVSQAADPEVLFDGKNLSEWEFAEGAWVIDDDGAMTCRMETVTARDGTKRERGMGYIWTKKSYEDFELTLSYKVSEGCNSGVFFRSDKDNPVQGGFEIQLMDDEGFQKKRGQIGAKHLNGAFYDAKPASSNPAGPAGSWNEMTLKCDGPHIQVSINGVLINDVNVDDWDTPQKNPDGSANKFKTALKDLPREGRIGFQNHGQVVWFKDVTVRSLE